ncbi:hypothetical protein Ocin01_03382 [Orchesella cincta]|uniref:DUF243 domain-containing protein n=1 Tax=Orchesella cincta TaxID=48709 RepID=A0A1D2NE79_ORCCI|nr:hypothetical protein Ocin01_03382 [Orchesella cincta]
MKPFVVFAAILAMSSAEPPVGGYSSGPSGGSSGFGGFSSGDNVRKYVSVHVAGDDPIDSQARVIRVPGGQDKHVNIIFVKTPSGSSEQQTEVILPEQPQQRNLVYVLVKKEEVGSNIKIRGPQATSPPKPEVYFIRQFQFQLRVQ